MRNPWRMQDGPDNKINRNNFPMSFQYNGTFKYGKIYPIGLIRTIPGASYQIDSTLALNFMPTSFPIQTRQRAYVHFFYGRDRNFWKDYKDFVNGMNPDLVKPYLDESVTQARTGNLLDYLGVPTTLVGKYGAYEVLSSYSDSDFYYNGVTKIFPNLSVKLNDNLLATYTIEQYQSWIDELSSISKDYYTPSQVSSQEQSPFGYVFGVQYSKLKSDPNYSRVGSVRFRTLLSNGASTYDEFYLSPFNSEQYSKPTPLSQNYRLNFCRLVITNEGGAVKHILPVDLYDQNYLGFSLSVIEDLDLDDKDVISVIVPLFLHASNSNTSNYRGAYTDSYKLYSNGFVLVGTSDGIKDIDEETSPYWRSGATTDVRKRIKLNAIPCRMYETIYNLYYRNPQNNPYILNGKPEYNVFIPSKDGGVDSNLYELRYRNWEDDFLTTAVQTPQQGIAPLVGLTDRGATVTLTNEDGSVTRYVTNLDENGNVTGIETTDSSEPLLTQALIDAVSYGISIEDLRNVNAMQKWLELNLRKGYQYKDIIEARWGISISYNELDLPEFIGGFTQEVGLQAVTQTTSHGDGIEGALGWQAGRMYASGEGRSITHYCEEEGYIMALLTVVPVPNYSQLLPKHWFTRDLLDSYQPEFNHIGFQPITYKEVCPIQAYQESTENVDVLEQTFGYQRPWYEYFNQVDEVHGQFRTTFKDFLINRTFDVKPELSESFLLVDPNQVNDVFAVTTDDDKILGAINHRIVAKLPISLYAQARLE